MACASISKYRMAWEVVVRALAEAWFEAEKEKKSAHCKQQSAMITLCPDGPTSPRTWSPVEGGSMPWLCRTPRLRNMSMNAGNGRAARCSSSKN